jgi:oligopeptide/dipeptide ABC transporter ATP-binding protein
MDIYKNDDVILDVRDLKVHFPIKKGMFRKTVGHVKAVDGVNFSIKEGETLGLVGESGCGKTTTGRSLIRLIEPTAGNVLYRDGDNITNISDLDKKPMKNLRKDIQMIFQDPYSSLNPRMTVYELIAEPMRVYKIGNEKSRKEKAAELLESVGLSASYLERYPNEFSGGQRQRIGIARALALEPKVILCDEPVSALDVSVQAQIINLLEDIQKELDLTFLFIAHDLSVIHHISDRVAVMYLGKIVEMADNKNLYSSPKHPYTEALLSAIPAPDPRRSPEHLILKGDVPNPASPPTGCNFHERCKYAKDICRQEEPELKAIKKDEDHLVACHFADELDLEPAVDQYRIKRNRMK